MSATQVIDMSSARVNVQDMSKMIQVRNVSDEMHRALKVKAAEEGMSLSDFIKRELSFAASKSSVDEIIARRRARGGRPSKMTPEKTVQIIREARGD
jgi:plasmid stability protein